MNINDLLATGIQEAVKFNGRFEGDANIGDFDIQTLGGTFSGRYVVKENVIEVIISKKPFLIPCAAIESFLKANIK